MEFLLVLMTAQIHKDLFFHFNIIPRKTGILQPPNIKNIKQIKAYIIGYIDGDGCIRKRKSDQLLILDIAGNYDILMWIKNIFEKIEPTKYDNKIIKNAIANCYSYRISGQRANNICSELKKLPILKLDRKWNLI